MSALLSPDFFLLQAVAVKGLKTQAHLAEINLFCVTCVTTDLFFVCLLLFFVPITSSFATVNVQLHSAV